jgi:hypothetical protein
VSRSIRFSFFSARTTRFTKIPGTWMKFGSSDPTGTISSTSATVIRPAFAIDSLKFLAVFRKMRLPASSAFHALTSAKSAVIACGDVYALARTSLISQHSHLKTLPVGSAGHRAAACAITTRTPKP